MSRARPEPPMGSELAIVCVHSTRRTRRTAVVPLVEVACTVCTATLIMGRPTLDYARGRRLDVLPVCPSCAPDVVNAQEYVMPGTAELLERYGLTDGQQVDGDTFLDEQQARPTDERMAELLRNTVGGQG